MNQKQDIEAAIAALEAQRPHLGNHVVDLAIAPLRKRLGAGEFDGWTQDARRLKQVTILFTDIVDSTRMSEQLDPEDIHATMDHALEELGKIIQGHDGRVLRFAGDGLLAVFGAVTSSEDDPQRAVIAGLDLLAAARELAPQIERSHGLAGFSIRVGVNTGRVLLGGGVEQDNSIHGIAVNVAARMEQSAPAGTVRISHDTYRHVRGVFDVSEQPPLAVKGVSRPIQSYLVHALKPDASRVPARGIDGVETRMVGRDGELAQLQQAYRALHDQGRMQVVTVVAEAGIGKSRLLQEFANWSASQDTPCTLFEGKCHTRTRRQAYGLMRNVLARRFDIAQGDSMDVARDKFLRAVLPLFGDDAVAQVGILGHLVGIDFSAVPELRGALDDPRQIRNRGFHAAAQMFRLPAARDNRPGLLLLDDLHWADDDSLDFLDYLLDENADVPMLIVAFTRPDFYERRPRWPRGNAAAQTLRLHALEQSSSEALAQGLLERLQNVPESLLKLLTGQAGGNPFYLEEMVRVLLDDGVIAVESGRWRLQRDKLDTLRVPDTLTGVLQARLDRLTGGQRATLQRSSVIGYAFWDSALPRVTECVESLRALVSRELVVPKSHSAIAGEREFRFHHHILHQVTYDSILRQERESFHLSAARWMEGQIEKGGAGFLGATAEHYEHAARPQKAAHYFTLAAESAASRHSRDATLQFVERGLALTDETNHSQRWRLLAAREEILASQDDRAAHDTDLANLMAIADTLEDEGLKARALLRRGVAFNNAGHYAAADSTCNEAYQSAVAAEQIAIAAKALETRAFALRRMGDFDAAKPVARDGLALARQGGFRIIEGELLANLSGLAAESGDLIEGMRLSAGYLAIARELGDPVREAAALNIVGDNTFRLGDYPAARQYFEDTLRLSRKIGHRYSECIALLNLALVANLQNDSSHALGFAVDAVAIARRSGLRDLDAAASLQYGMALCALGQFEKAHKALCHSRDLFRDNGGVHLTMEPVAGLARLALEQGDLAEALCQVERILRHLEDGGTLDGNEEPLQILWTCGLVLMRAKDSRGPALIDAAHHQLRQRASRITDPAMRTTFLEQVPHNRAIVAAACGELR